MSNKFSDFLEEIEAEAHAEGPAAVAEMVAFDERYRLARELMLRRREAGITQAQLAKRVGLGQAEVSRIEAGRGNPTIGTLAAVAHGLGYGFSLIPLEAKTPAPPVRTRRLAHATP